MTWKEEKNEEDASFVSVPPLIFPMQFSKTRAEMSSTAAEGLTSEEPKKRLLVIDNDVFGGNDDVSISYDRRVDADDDVFDAAFNFDLSPFLPFNVATKFLKLCIVVVVAAVVVAVVVIDKKPKVDHL